MINEELVENRNEKSYRNLAKCISIIACSVGFAFMIIVGALFVFGIAIAFSGSSVVTNSDMTVKSDMVVTAEAVTGSGIFSFVIDILRAIMMAVVYGIAFAFTCAVSIASENFENKIVDYLVGRKDQVLEHQSLSSKVHKLHRYQLLKLTELLFSANTQNDVFLPIMADWDNEVFNAIKNNNNKFMITTRNLYAFLKSMWMKSPIGDLIEFIQKFAK